VAYREQIAEADRLVEEKNYEAAKKSYEKALSLKPGEAYPADRIAKLGKIIAEMDAFQKELKGQ
jgi:hypothetical protein